MSTAVTPEDFERLQAEIDRLKAASPESVRERTEQAAWAQRQRRGTEARQLWRAELRRRGFAAFNREQGERLAQVEPRLAKVRARLEQVNADKSAMLARHREELERLTRDVPKLTREIAEVTAGARLEPPAWLDDDALITREIADEFGMAPIPESTEQQPV